MSLHFLMSYFGSQSSVSANTEKQIKKVFLKEFSKWRMKIPDELRNNIRQLDNEIKIDDGTQKDDEEKDWFLRAVVAKPETSESVAGLHGEHVMLLFDEASAIHRKIYEVVEGALTGENLSLIHISEPTRPY